MSPVFHDLLTFVHYQSVEIKSKSFFSIFNMDCVLRACMYISQYLLRFSDLLYFIYRCSEWMSVYFWQCFEVQFGHTKERRSRNGRLYFHFVEI